MQLEPGESQQIKFRLTREDLATVGPNFKWSTEPGAYTVLVGSLHQELTVR